MTAFKKTYLRILFFCGVSFNMHSLSAQQLNYIFKSGEQGYACFRIPSLITTAKGTLLAFSEARKISCSDAGDIDLVVKRSSDGGKTWSSIQMVWNDSNDTCGNPAPVIDRSSGRIVLLSTWNLGTDVEKNIENGTSKDTRRVFVLHSADDGNTWSQPEEITGAVKKDAWNWYATGPGRGVQVAKGKYKGRMVVSCNFKEKETRKNYSYAIYSDDQGRHWVPGGITPQDSVNESTVAELSNGSLMLNMRNASSKRQRQVATSMNGGMSWSDIAGDTSLIEPVCEGSLLGYRVSRKKYVLAFSNPASTSSRSHLTVKWSYDDGKTWPDQKLVYEGPSAYSCLTVLPNGNTGLLYEAGLLKPYEGIAFAEIQPGGSGSSK